MIDKKKFRRALCAVVAAGLCLGAAAEGFSGEEILQIEQGLYSLGYHDEQFDGQLDERTRQALRSFQIANGLEVTGEPDGNTMKRLTDGTAVTCHDYLVALAAEYADLPILQSGSAGESVSALQRKLKELGYFAGECDGVYGDATQAAIGRFQMANGLTETGIADQATQFRLNESNPMGWARFLEWAAASGGDCGQQVSLLQRTLRDRGYFHGECSGNFGEWTQRAVQRFQQDNGLLVTGMADAETCTALYSGAAMARDSEILRRGDSGDHITGLQSELGAFGYFDQVVTGVYDTTTETAVRLFQLANGLEVSGEANPEMRAKLRDGSAVRLDDAYDGFLMQMSAQDENTRAVLGSMALGLRGRPFRAAEEEFYQGFAFVQYVCAAAGVPVPAPEALMAQITEPVSDPGDLREGDILALRETSGGPVLLAISSGGGRVIYATASADWVLESDLRVKKYAELVRWNMSAAQ